MGVVEDDPQDRSQYLMTSSSIGRVTLRRPLTCRGSAGGTTPLVSYADVWSSPLRIREEVLFILRYKARR